MKRLLFLLMIGFLISMAACSNDDTTEEEQLERIVAVETAQVTEEDFILERSLYGRATPNRVTPIMIPLSGEITELDVRAGDQVEEGDRIAILTTAQGKTNITAPIDGQVTGLSATEGDTVSNEEPLAMIAETETMVFEFSVTANVQQILKVDETYIVNIADEEMEATISQIDSMPNDTGLYPIQTTVKNKENTILPGMVGKITIHEQVIEEALTVPTAAIVQENNVTFVYVIKNNQAEKRTITVQETGSETSAIEGDIAAGDEVVVAGQLTLSDGDQVDVQEEE